jgi:hypothetical protein
VPVQNNFKLILLLFIPIVIFYAGYYFNHDANDQPTGFIQYDNVGYAAYAKQYLDEPSSSIFYSNPFNDSPENAKIYFQTQNIFLSAMMWVGISPGLSLCIYSIVFAFLTILIIIKIYDTVFPNSTYRKISLVLLTWGGGALVLAGVLALPFRNTKGTDLLQRLFYLDPGNGWWGLNFGRPLLFGVESYYHFLFLSAILLLLKKKWLYASALAFILSFSHPFTGIHFLLVMLAWVTTEKILFKSTAIPWWLPLLNLLLIGIHLYYYLIYMPSFPDHKNVIQQYSLDWHYKIYHFLPAYILVFSLFIFSVRIQKIKQFVNYLPNRLFLCMAIVSLLLSNHELFIKPMQPIHFARGYEWIAYFFMGVPALHFFIKKLSQKKLLLLLFCGILLLDNFLWIINYVRDPKNHPVTHISREQREILNILETKSDVNTLIIGRDKAIPYLATVYTKAYTWISHPFTTSYYQFKWDAYVDFLNTGKVNAKWLGRKLIFVFNKSDKAEISRLKKMPVGYSILFNGRTYFVLETVLNENE